jgi:hypothetical protein
MGFEIVLEFCVIEVLLTQQYTAPSASAEEVHEEHLVLGLGFGLGFFKCPFEPILGGS